MFKKLYLAMFLILSINCQIASKPELRDVAREIQCRVLGCICCEGEINSLTCKSNCDPIPEEEDESSRGVAVGISIGIIALAIITIFAVRCIIKKGKQAAEKKEAKPKVEEKNQVPFKRENNASLQKGDFNAVDLSNHPVDMPAPGYFPQTNNFTPHNQFAPNNNNQQFEANNPNFAGFGG